MTSSDREFERNVDGQRLAGGREGSGPPPAADRSTVVKGRPDWLNEDQCASPVTNHVVPIYTSWVSRLMRRDFYRISYGAWRFNSESDQPLNTWIREIEARIASVRKAAADRLPMPDMDEYVTLEVATHKVLSRKMLALISAADKASSWRFSAGDLQIDESNQIADWLSEPFAWVKNRQTVAGSSRFQIFHPGVHIVVRESVTA
jgi:hypothetical protein